MRKPEWLKVGLHTGTGYQKINKLLKQHSLNAVCREALCPNRHKCWNHGRTATFMMLGDTCTRPGRCCNVNRGRGRPPVKAEPRRIALAVNSQKLKYVCITMVTRDGVARHLDAMVTAIRGLNPVCSMEVLAKEINPGQVTKTTLMPGLGESEAVVKQSLMDLSQAGVDIINLGQYLRPSRSQVEVTRYMALSEFEAFKKCALDPVFAQCDSGPLVRSSYHAKEQYERLRLAA